MNFTSPKSQIQATNQIFTSALAGLPVRDSPKTVDNFLVKWESGELQNCTASLEQLDPTFAMCSCIV